MKRLATCTATIAVLCVLGSMSALAAERVFVLMPNAPGQSTDATHTNWIDAYAADFNLVKPTGGQAPPAPLAFLKAADRASPLIRQAVNTGQIQGIIRIEICGIPPSGGPDRCYFKLELAGSTLVSAFHLTESTCANPTTCTPALTESVTINYTKLTTTWVNSAGGETKTCWDFLTGMAC